MASVPLTSADSLQALTEPFQQHPKLEFRLQIKAAVAHLREGLSLLSLLVNGGGVHAPGVNEAVDLHSILKNSARLSGNRKIGQEKNR